MKKKYNHQPLTPPISGGPEEILPLPPEIGQLRICLFEFTNFWRPEEFVPPPPVFRHLRFYATMRGWGGSSTALD